jgi:prepilin-type N-terminal cleavage/methylation domain-containing protein
MMHARSNQGFTLAELVVASTLISVVLIGVYHSFSTSMRVWRGGMANVDAYQDARTSMAILRRELQSIVPGSEHLVEGESDWILFYAEVPPLDVKLGHEPRVMQIRYRIRKSRDDEGRQLVREEAAVEGPLPPAGVDGETTEGTKLEVGRKRSFELATGVKRLRFEYFWLVVDEDVEELMARDFGGGMPPRFFETVVENEQREGWGLPQGLRYRLTLHHPQDDEQELSFAGHAVYRGPTGSLTDREEGAF